MEKKFQILSLDGGGLKGIFSAAFLAHLEDDYNTNIIDHFDLIVGTSTGGIVALGLGMGMTPKEIIHFYTRYGPQIFPNKYFRSIKQFYKSKHDSLNLESSLKECFGNKCLADSKKRLVIPSYNIGDDDVYLFKTPHHSRLKRDYKVPVWKVAMATSAAPTFLPVFTEVDHVRLIDGGIWANNPIMVGVTEAISTLDIEPDEIFVMSIGTTNEVKGRSEKLNSGGFWQWKKDAVEVLMRAQSIGALAQAKLILGEDHVSRMDPKVPDGMFALDRMSSEDLLSKAAHESRHFAPVFQRKFLNHKAAEFSPIYNMEGEKTA
jgi:patatin-like phospholipase/acyl hydrolase